MLLLRWQKVGIKKIYFPGSTKKFSRSSEQLTFHLPHVLFIIQHRTAEKTHSPDFNTIGIPFSLILAETLNFLLVQSPLLKLV